MITLNATTLNRQPTDVLEETLPIQTDVEAIDGSITRNFIQNKYQVSLTWSKLNPTEYLQIYGFATATGVVTYLNTLSDYSGGQLTFNGLPKFKEVKYEHGASVLRDITVVIRQQ